MDCGDLASGVLASLSKISQTSLVLFAIDIAPRKPL
jgi:hypothetical protein